MDEKIIAEALKKALPVLQKGERVELIPVKDGVKVMRVKREEVKSENHKTRQVL